MNPGILLAAKATLMYPFVLGVLRDVPALQVQTTDYAAPELKQSKYKFLFSRKANRILFQANKLLTAIFWSYKER